MPITKPLLGLRFGRLLVTVEVETGRSRKVTAQCDCGVVKQYFAGNLRKCVSTSCGCGQREGAKAQMRRHGKKGSKIYKVWESMRRRCSPEHGHADYSGRGITVCERWGSFESFYEDMGDIPDGKTIDRKDNNGNYEPDNCRWATPVEQARNRRSNIVVVVGGEPKTLTEACEKIPGVKYATARYRLLHGSPIEQALTPTTKG